MSLEESPADWRMVGPAAGVGALAFLNGKSRALGVSECRALQGKTEN